MNDYLFRGIPAPLVQHFWPFAEPYIKRALDHTSGEMHVMDFYHSCINRDMQLWLVSKGDRIVGAVTTEIVNYPHKRHCRVITIAGTAFAEWTGLVDETLSKWAVEQECSAIESFVRKGLVPRMAPFGYKHKHSLLLKELTG